MGYAINSDGAYRAVDPDWELHPGESYSETLPAPSAEQQAAALLEEMKQLVQAEIDRAARARDYTDGLHAASYAVSTIAAWAAEGQAFVAWRDQVWLTAIGIMNACQAGMRAIPSAETLLAELPRLEWPNE